MFSYHFVHIKFPTFIFFQLSVGTNMSDMIAEVIEDSREALDTGVNDVIVVEQSDGSFLSTPIVVQLGKLHHANPGISLNKEIKHLIHRFLSGSLVEKDQIVAGKILGS